MPFKDPPAIPTAEPMKEFCMRNSMKTVCMGPCKTFNASCTCPRLRVAAIPIEGKSPECLAV